MAALRCIPLFVLLLTSVSCGRSDVHASGTSGIPTPAAPAEAPASDPVAEPASDPPQAAANQADAPPLDAAQLYGMCRDRVEGPESDGECASDEDCVAVGCSSEICTTRDKGAGMMSTCDNKPCYAALDTCGCAAGRCQWSLKDGPIEPTLPIQLPPR